MESLYFVLQIQHPLAISVLDNYLKKWRKNSKIIL